MNGDARIVDDEAELARFEFRRHIPKVAIAVTVKEAFLHCAKALKRSRLWEEDAKIDRSTFARAGDIVSDHIKGGKSGDEIEAILKDNYRTQLY